MYPILQTPTNGVLSLRPVVSSGVLTAGQNCNSNAWCAEGEFGYILLEEFCFGHFTIRLTYFHLQKPMTLYYSSPMPSICARLSTKNKWSITVNSEESIHLPEGHFTLHRTEKDKEEISFEKEGEYRCFEVFCPAEKLWRLVNLFPLLDEFLASTDISVASFLVKRAHWAPPEALDIIRHIHACPFNDSLGDYYMQSKLEQLFFLLMAIALKEKPAEASPTKNEIKAAHIAERIIMADIKQHYSIPTIARKVGLNEFRLKYVFKHIFKTGIFDYLLQARMREAKNLLAYTDKPIKEIASLTGYQRLTSFITAFRKYFGYTPGFVRRTEPDYIS